MSICRSVHMVPVLRRSRPFLTLKAQKADRYMSRTGIKMRSGPYAAPCQYADTGGRRSSYPVCYQRPGQPDRSVRRSRFEGS